jgi:transcriptional regulator with XRE-family HTH domain
VKVRRRVAEPDPFLVALGAAIRARRTDLGMTQAELGLAVGASQRRVWEWENAKRDLRLTSSLRPLAAALRMSGSALMSAAEVRFEDESR